MYNKKVFILVIFCLFIYLTECRGGRGGGGRSSSSSRGGSSWGKGWGGSSSSSSWSKPSTSWGSSSGSSWGSSGNSYKPSTSWNTGSSSGSSWGSSSGSHSYPSSTGLSGSGSSKYPSSSGTHSYPSNTGLSGSGTGSHSYPSGTGLSGSGSSKYPSSSGTHSYPSNTGLWGSGTGSHSYPSGTGLSGSGSSKYPSSSGTHSYPSNTGLSGSGSGTRYNYNNHGSSYQSHYVPTYYTAPQHVYVTEYRDSGSRYGDLLTGLTLYNMGRSHSYHHDHYYYDDYYRHRYQPTGSNNYQQSTYDKPNSEATCTLRIKNNGKLDILKIPCEIVSTFTEGKKVESETHANNTVCTSNTTVTKYSPVVTNTTVTTVDNFTLEARDLLEKLKAFNSHNVTTTAKSALDENTALTNESYTATKLSPVDNFTLEARDLLEKLKAFNSNNVTTPAKPAPDDNTAVTNGSNTEVVGSGVQNNVTAKVNPATTTPNVTHVFVPIVTKINKTDGNVFTQTIKTQTETETIVNVTVCTTINYTDPLSLKGGSITDTSNMECSVDIRTKDAHFRNPVQCKTLMEYSKMPPPKAGPKPLLPPREKLKSWMEKPPWWMSMFIAV